MMLRAMNSNGADSAGNPTPFGNQPIDRSSVAPKADVPPVQGPADDDNIPFDEPPFDPRESWDANDERRQRDQFAPPSEPCECYCLHCQRTFMSDQIWLQRVKNARDGFDGFWMCPTHNCSGAGFTFDIFPTDPEHPANAGWHYDDDEDEDYDPEEDDDLEEAFDPDDVGNNEPVADYDPHESKYKDLDDEMGDAASDIAEGDEWKLGLAPGEKVPPQAYWSENARKEWEKEQADYDAPDRRPREIESDEREDRRAGGDDESEFKEDDIPF
jgi:hypothetical protein